MSRNLTRSTGRQRGIRAPRLGRPPDLSRPQAVGLEEISLERLQLPRGLKGHSGAVSVRPKALRSWLRLTFT
jgi:hypothetical protein